MATKQPPRKAPRRPKPAGSEGPKKRTPAPKKKYITMAPAAKRSMPKRRAM